LWVVGRRRGNAVVKPRHRLTDLGIIIAVKVQDLQQDGTVFRARREIWARLSLLLSSARK
jgi:hypothetical protein